jgi:hypothetical protein
MKPAKSSITNTSGRALIVVCGVLIVSAFALMAVVATRHSEKDPSSDTREGRQFLAAFEQSVRECLQEESMAQVHVACDAAMACRSESASRTVEERCLEAYRHGYRMEQLVAGYVLTEWNRTVRPETKAELRELMLKSVPAEGTREDIKYLLEHLEKLEQGAKQQQASQSAGEGDS